jgi:hypothetical protein
MPDDGHALTTKTKEAFCLNIFLDRDEPKKKASRCKG